jgi:hypothetical protein
MNRDEPSITNDPAADGTSRATAQTASRLSGGRQGPAVEQDSGYLEDTVNRSEAGTTPRRYEQPVADDDDPVMPAADSTLNTKI